MAKKSTMRKRYALPRWYKIALILLISLIILSPIGYFLYWRSSLPTYDDAVQECGGKKPILTNSIMGKTYELPSDKTYRIPNDGGSVLRDYFCTESEAKAAGYKHSVLGN